MKIFILTILLYLTFLCFGQAQTTNPFELISDDQLETPTIVQDTQSTLGSTSITSNQTSNPFDIQTHQNEPFKEDTASKSSTEISNFDLINADEETNTPLEQTTSITDTSQSQGNPFELKKTPITTTKPATSPIQDKPTEPILNSKKSKRTKSSNSNVLTFIIFIISGLVLSILFSFDRNIVKNIRKSISNSNFMNSYQKSENNGFSNAFGLLYIVYILQITLFIFLYLNHSVHIEVNTLTFFKILSFVLITILLRHIVLRIVDLISFAEKSIKSYYFIIIIINSVLGLLLLPINLLIAFGPQNINSISIKVGIICVIGCILWKWIRGIICSLKLIINDTFHFFLYLCGTEILPILLVIRFILNSI